MVDSDNCARRGRTAIITGCLLALFLSLPDTTIADEDSRAGHGHVNVTYQQIRVDGFEGSAGTLAIGKVDTHVLNVDVEYYLTDRWTVSAGIPYIRERYRGTFAHDPLLLDPPRPEIENIDQGQWNQGFQDFHFAVRYLAKATGQFRIEPFVVAGFPSNDYPFFGHAAIGQNLWRIEPGATFLYKGPFSDTYYRLDLGYAFVEETLGVSIDHWNIRAEAGHFFNHQLTGRVFVLHKDGDGLVFPDDFPPPRNNELWYQHDRLIKHNFTNAGVGLDWSMSERYVLSSSVLTMVRAEQVHKVDFAFTLGLSFSF